MSDTSTIDLSENRIAAYYDALSHANQSFSRAPMVEESTLRILGALSNPARPGTELIQRTLLRPMSLDAQKTLTELHVAVVRAVIDSSQALSSVMSSGSLPVAHFQDITCRIARSEWHSLFAKLEGFRSCKDGWNGYRAPAPNAVAIDNARMFLDVMRESLTTPTRVSASAVGGVGITCREGSKKVYVEFFNNSMVSALFADDDAQSMFTNQADPDWESYEKLILDVKDYLSGRNARRDEN